jgi:Phage capsid protein
MAGEIDEWKVRAYASNVQHLAQAMQNRLRGTTREENKIGHSIAFRRLGAMEGHDVTERLSPIVHAVADHSERLVFPTGWDFAAIVDSFDKAQQIHDPESEYAKSGASSYNRTVDRRIISAALGSAAQRSGGPEGTISLVVFDSNQVIANATTGLTKKKVVAARALLGNNVNEELEIYGPLYFVYSPLDINFLFNEVTITSTDYVTMQALMSGKMVRGFMGFDWIPTNQLPVGVTAANIRNCFCFAKAGLGFGTNMGSRKERMDERNDIQGHPMQVEIYDEFGAVRIDEKLVVRVDVDVTATPP